MLLNTSLPLLAISSKPSNTSLAPKGRYFNFMPEQDMLLCQKDYYIAQRKIGQLSFIEIKCSCDTDWHFTVANAHQTFWMVFQLLGNSFIDDAQKHSIEQQQYQGYFNEENTVRHHLRSGKMWMILIGLEISDIKLLSTEWRMLSAESGSQLSIRPAQKIAFRINKILQQIQHIKDSPFSLKYKLPALMVQLMDTYHADILEHARSMRQDDIPLLHQAKDYIMKHYMDEEIDIQVIADKLLTSERTLYRIFKENGLTVNSAIRTIRIYKGREMLRRTDKSVDMIAFYLQFSTARYFIKQYVNYFGHTPAMERKLNQRPSLRKTK
ncbi:helix-turn-helix transcriptional regulator [Sphingobacterium alkalisoli]|uniref:Helix-turn-helix transcriptional regulator n=1 Tax=Sphingobacterium alkalisoli TaxID=1874115 RepID=A0A4U0GWC9_9SPHI|nr:AraC family transcriptional regulator [Sphingobacterium alkalisoli]TJY63430.1 helix-turn-helix transcriptional regulator [Sphingobacterium alkalisoli]